VSNYQRVKDPQHALDVDLFKYLGTNRYYERVPVEGLIPDDRPNTLKDPCKFVYIGRFACDADAIKHVMGWSL